MSETNTTITAALGLGEDYHLPNGSSVRLYPAKLRDLDKVMPLYNMYGGYTIQGLYLPGREESRTAFENLLLIASGNGALSDEKDDEKRRAAVSEVLDLFGDIGDQGDGVRGYIDRFLGLVPATTAPAEADQGE